jgi:hypothetical protein
MRNNDLVQRHLNHVNAPLHQVAGGDGRYWTVSAREVGRQELARNGCFGQVSEKPTARSHR